MTNICTKVTVRKRPIKNGQLSLYLDFYPPVRHPKTGKPTRREYLGIYIYANPTDKFEAEFNKTMLRNAELIKCRRTEAIINEEYGFLDRNRGKESFLEYFRSKMADDDNFRNWNTAYKHFERYCGGNCTFDDLTVEYCQGFLTYMLSLTTQTKTKIMASTANNNLNKLKCVLRIAYEEKRIKENIAPRLKHAKESSTRREFLTLEEVRMLADTPCEKPVIRTAALFSCALATSSACSGRTSSRVRTVVGACTSSPRRQRRKPCCRCPMKHSHCAVSVPPGRCSRGLRRPFSPCISKTG